MACNVFGTPVTDATLKKMIEYHDKVIKTVDRARVAIEMKNAEGKDTAARNYVDNKIQTYVCKKRIRCLIYNATGTSLKLATAYLHSGLVLESPYPNIIQNGQWASIVYYKDTDEVSMGAFMYETTRDPARQWVFGWSQKKDELIRCYAEFQPKGLYYRKEFPAGAIESLKTHLTSARYMHEVQDDGDIILSTGGSAEYPIYEAILTKTDAM